MKVEQFYTITCQDKGPTITHYYPSEYAANKGASLHSKTSEYPVFVCVATENAYVGLAVYNRSKRKKLRK